MPRAGSRTGPNPCIRLAVAVGIVGALASGGLTWMLTRPPPLPKQFEVTGRIYVVRRDAQAVVVSLDDGGKGFYGIAPGIQGRELIEPGRHLRLEILVGDGVGEFVVAASPA